MHQPQHGHYWPATQVDVHEVLHADAYADDGDDFGVVSALGWAVLFDVVILAGVLGLPAVVDWLRSLFT